MDNTRSTATVECAFKHILNTFSNREKNMFQSPCMLTKLQS